MAASSLACWRGLQPKHALGLSMLFGTAVIWIVSSFISEALVSSHEGTSKATVPPFLLTYLATTMFTLYLPMVHIKQWTSDYLATRRAHATGISTPSKLKAAVDEEGAQLLGSGSGKASHGPTMHRQAMTTALWCAPLWFLAQCTFNMSLARTSITSNTILSSTSSLFTFGFSILLLGEQFTGRKLLCIMACIGGTALVTLSDSSAAAATTPPGAAAAGEARSTAMVVGDALVLVSGLFYGLYTVMMRRLMPRAEEEGTAVALFFGFVGLFTSLALAPVVATMVAAGSLSLTAIPRQAYGLIVLEGLLDYVLADFLWARSVMLLGPTVATLGLSVQIPMAAAAEVAIGSPAWARQLSSIAMTIGGTAFIFAGFVGVNVGNGGAGGKGSPGTPGASWDDAGAKDSGSEEDGHCYDAHGAHAQHGLLQVEGPSGPTTPSHGAGYGLLMGEKEGGGVPGGELHLAAGVTARGGAAADSRGSSVFGWVVDGVAKSWGQSRAGGSPRLGASKKVHLAGSSTASSAGERERDTALLLGGPVRDGAGPRGVATTATPRMPQQGSGE